MESNKCFPSVSTEEEGESAANAMAMAQLWLWLCWDLSCDMNSSWTTCWYIDDIDLILIYDSWLMYDVCFDIAFYFDSDIGTSTPLMVPRGWRTVDLTWAPSNSNQKSSTIQIHRDASFDSLISINVLSIWCCWRNHSQKKSQHITYHFLRWLYKARHFLSFIHAQVMHKSQQLSLKLVSEQQLSLKPGVIFQTALWGSLCLVTWPKTIDQMKNDYRNGPEWSKLL